MAAKQGDIGFVRALRENVALYAPSSAAAKQAWTERPEFDAWIT